MRKKFRGGRGIFFIICWVQLETLNKYTCLPSITRMALRKANTLPSATNVHLANRPCSGRGTCPVHASVCRVFLARHSAKPYFAECLEACTRQRTDLRLVCRVPDILHSAKLQALGKQTVSDSDVLASWFTIINDNT